MGDTLLGEKGSVLMENGNVEEVKRKSKGRKKVGLGSGMGLRSSFVV